MDGGRGDIDANTFIGWEAHSSMYEPENDNDNDDDRRDDDDGAS